MLNVRRGLNWFSSRGAYSLIWHMEKHCNPLAHGLHEQEQLRWLPLGSSPFPKFMGWSWDRFPGYFSNVLCVCVRVYAGVLFSSKHAARMRLFAAHTSFSCRWLAEGLTCTNTFFARQLGSGWCGFFMYSTCPFHALRSICLGSVARGIVMHLYLTGRCIVLYNTGILYWQGHAF